MRWSAASASRVEVAVEARRQVRARPDPRLELQRSGIPNVEECLVRLRVVTLIEQPAVSFCGFSWPRDEHTFSERPVRSRANALLPPRDQIEPHNCGKGEEIDGIFVDGVEVPGVRTDASRIKTRKLVALPDGETGRASCRE